MSHSNTASRRGWLIFLLVAIAQFMLVLDVSITNVALPAIGRDLHLTADALQWVVTAYALSFGGFLLLGGRAADLFGRRLVLMGGMAAFTFISFMIGATDSATWIVVLRALQGIAAAFMSPAALSIVLVTFHEGAERNKALGYWSVVATIGAAAGLLFGGVLTQFFGWRWDFFVNVPVGIVILFCIWRFVPMHEKEERYTSLDLPGAALITAGLIGFVYAFTQAVSWGWTDFRVLGIVALSVVLVVGFWYNESRVREPLMPPSIFRIRNVTGANLMMVPITAGMFGMFFLLTLYVQDVLGYPPVLAGFAFLPFPIVLSIFATRIPGWVARYGFKRFLIAGPMIAAIAQLWLARVPLHGAYLTDLLPAFILMATGLGITFMPIIAAATSGVPAHEAGLSSGLITTSQQMGGALGLAILSGIATSVIAASNLSSAEAQVHGYHVAFFVASGFLVGAALLAALVIREPRSTRG